MCIHKFIKMIVDKRNHLQYSWVFMNAMVKRWWYCVGQGVGNACLSYVSILDSPDVEKNNNNWCLFNLDLLNFRFLKITGTFMIVDCSCNLQEYTIGFCIFYMSICTRLIYAKQYCWCSEKRTQLCILRLSLPSNWAQKCRSIIGCEWKVLYYTLSGS